MILWSVALAAFLLLGAWGGANWRAFHLAYYKNRSQKDPHDPAIFEQLYYHHLHKGMAKKDVAALFSAYEVLDRRGEHPEVWTLVVTYGFLWQFEFEDDKLVAWRAAD